MGVSPNSRTSFADYKEILEAVDVRCPRTLVLICRLQGDIGDCRCSLSPNSRTSFANYKEVLEAVDVRCLRTRVLHLPNFL